MSKIRNRATALALTGLTALGGGVVAATTLAPAASAGVIMNIRAYPSTSAPILGNVDASCAVAGPDVPWSRHVDTPEGRWWSYGNGWILADGSWCI